MAETTIARLIPPHTRRPYGPPGARARARGAPRRATIEQRPPVSGMGGGPEARSYGDAPEVEASKPYADGDAVAMYARREHTVRQKLVHVEKAKARYA